MPDSPGHRSSKRKEPYRPVSIRTHAQLAAKTTAITAQLNNNPDLAAAMLINPAAAIQEAGYKLAPDIISHVIETVRHSKGAAERMSGLQQKLSKELGETPKPLDSAWLAKVLFDKLKLKPLMTGGVEPKYRQPFQSELLKRLEKFRPNLRKLTVQTPTPLHGVAIKVDLVHKSPLRLDLDAKLPQLKLAQSPPKNVDLNTLYFYKDSHPLVRPLIELALIQRSSFPLHSLDSYRRIRSGQKSNPLRTWVRSVRFSTP